MRKNYEELIMTELKTTGKNYFPYTMAEKIGCTPKTAARYMASLARQGKIKTCSIPRHAYSVNWPSSFEL